MGGRGHVLCSLSLFKIATMAGIYEFLQCDADTILGTSIKIKEWEIKPLTVRQLININPHLAKISMLDEFQDYLKEAQDNADENGEIGDIYANKLVSLVGLYAEEVNSVVTIIIGRDISDEATPEDYVYLLSAIIYRMGGKSFLKSIRLSQNLSPHSKAGLIAAENRLQLFLTSPSY